LTAAIREINIQILLYDYYFVTINFEKREVLNKDEDADPGKRRF